MDDAGYNVYEPDEIEALNQIYGSNIVGNTAPPITTPKTHEDLKDIRIQNVVTPNVITPGYGDTGTKINGQKVITNLDTSGGHKKGYHGSLTSTVTHQHQDIHGNIKDNIHGSKISPISTQNENVKKPSGSFSGQNIQPIKHHITIGPNGMTVSNHNSYPQQQSQNALAQQNTGGPLNQEVGTLTHTETSVTNQHNLQTTSSQQSHQNPQNIGGSNQVCSFIQTSVDASGKIQGHKVCTNVNEGQQSIEVGSGLGNAYMQSAEVLNRGKSFSAFEDSHVHPSDPYGYRLGVSLGLNPVHARLVRHLTILPNGQRIVHLSRNTRGVNKKSTAHKSDNLKDINNRYFLCPLLYKYIYS